MRFVFEGCLLMFLVSCSSSSDNNNGGGGTTLYPATCEQACQKQASCGSASDENACVADCKSEPWPKNFVQCRSAACGLSDTECERYGVMTCDQACNNALSCGLESDLDSCIADCTNEPWPGNFIDCRATSCASDSDCEKFSGN